VTQKKEFRSCRSQELQKQIKTDIREDARSNLRSASLAVAEKLEVRCPGFCNS
jgi:hypothetical protein